jgi:hypothetical protein
MNAIEGYIGNCHPENKVNIFLFNIICFTRPTDPNLGKIRIKIKVLIHFIYIYILDFFRQQLLVEC